MKSSLNSEQLPWGFFWSRQIDHCHISRSSQDEKLLKEMLASIMEKFHEAEAIMNHARLTSSEMAI